MDRTEKTKEKIIEKAYVSARRPQGEDEKDDLQEAVERLLRRRKEPKNMEHGAALLTLARGEASRQRRKRIIDNSADDRDFPTDPSVGIDEDLQRREMNKKIVLAIRMLARPLRLVIGMRYWRDMTISEAAAQMNIRPHSVYALERMALFSLRLALASDHGRELRKGKQVTTKAQATQRDLHLFGETA